MMQAAAVLTRADIEQIDVERAKGPSATLRLLALLKSLALALMGRVDELCAAVEAREAELEAREAELKAREAELKAREAEVAQLKQLVFGPRSERGKGSKGRKGSKRPPGHHVDPKNDAARQKEGQRKRRENRRKKKALPTETVKHPVPDRCERCGAEGPFAELAPEVSEQYEFVPARLVRYVHVRQKAVCTCGHVLCGSAPARVGDCAQYGPRLHAHAVVTKAADSLPLARLAKRFARAGVPMARSTLTDLFHRTATLLQPLYKRLLELVAEAEYVNADETTQPVMDVDKCHRAYIWTFIADTIIAYVFSNTRSGRTAEQVLGDSRGTLQVDAYTGYNPVTTPKTRTRVGCIAHARRYFYQARDDCTDEAEYVLDLVRELYKVEYAAAARGIVGTAEHLAMRQLQSKPLMDEWEKWLKEQQHLHPPKSPLGKAVHYALNQWTFLTRFLEDPKIGLDNNIAERALRVIALGRNNFRWVGNEQAGKNLAVLQTLVHTCVACGVNPEEYLADVLLRIDTHPASAMDDLLPMNWKPAA